MHVGSFYEQSTRIKLLPLFNTYFSTRKVAQWSLLHCCLKQSEKSLWVFLQYFPWKVLSMPIAEFYVSFAGKQTNSFRIKIGRGGHTRHLLRHRFTTNKLSPVTIPLNIVYRKLSWNSVGESFSCFRIFAFNRSLVTLSLCHKPSSDWKKMISSLFWYRPK